MDCIRQQVACVRRRLNMQRFARIAPWTLFASLVLAALALAIPKIWAWNLDRSLWIEWWIGGAVAVGLCFALSITLWRRHGMIDAAIELDRRCGLKERISSALALPASEHDTDAGRALVDDAARRVETVEVPRAFHVRMGWSALLPLLPAVAVFLILVLPDAEREKVEASTTVSKENQQVKRSAKELEKRLAKRQKEAEEKGLERLDDMIMKLRKGVDELTSKDDASRKKAMIKMNDLAKTLQQRRDELSDPEKMKRQFERLKDLERGPAKRVLQALKAGNVQKAMEELNRLTEKLRKGEMTAEDQKQLVKQLEDVQRKLQEMVASHEQAKRDLERQIEQKIAEGDLETAGKLQRKLDQLQQQDRSMKRLEDLASRFGNASESLKRGDEQDAAAQLDAMMSELQDLEAEMSELETINELMDEIASSKDSMNCEICDGEGCMSCQDGYNPFGPPGNGNGLGEGAGYGDRPEQDTDTAFYESRLRAKPKPGEAVGLGDASGPNRSGMSLEEVKEGIVSELSEDADPLTDQRLPRSQQDHVRQYYQRLGKGE
ncbi:MAG: hypothetical protein ACC628_15895 [Pirellulaceae bacterium]